MEKERNNSLDMDKQQKKSRRIIRSILIIIGCIFFLWFLLPVFTNVRPNIGNLTGMTVFGLLILYGIFFAPVNRVLSGLWIKKAGKVCEILIGLILAAILILAGITYGCMLHAAGQKPQKNASVIVLGCKVNGENPSLSLLARMDAALTYLENNPESVCVVTGGQGKEEVVTEASVMERWFKERGIAGDRLIVEDRASDTEENLLFSMQLLREKLGREPEVVIATNDFHVYRALYLAKDLGYDASPISAATPWWLYPTYVVREMYGILESWFLR